MANEIYHRSNWGNAVNDKYWADVYEKYSATNKMFIRSDYYENSNETDKLMADIYPKPSILLTPTAYDNGSLHSVKPVKTFGSELVTNGGFDTDLSGWTNSNNHWQWTSQGAYFPLISTHNPLTQILTNPVGVKLKITFTLNIIQGTVNFYYKNISNSSVAAQYTQSGTYTIETELVKQNTDINFSRYGGINTEFYLDNVSVKEITDADFDFSRGSSATRVNEKGLIEDVQILSGNLVQNGDFSELGSELITNGDFSNWTNDNPDGWTITGTENENNYITEYQGKARYVSDGSTLFMSQNILTTGKFYKVTADIVVNSGGGMRFQLGANGTHHVFTTTQSIVLYAQQDGADGNLQIIRQGATDFTIDNVSVKEVGQDWNFNNWKLTNNNVLLVDTSGYVNQVDVFVVGKNYKISVDVKDYTSGDLRIDSNGINLFTPSGSNTTATIFISNLDRTNLLLEGNFRGTITNISVIEITEDTDLPRINYTNGEGSLLLEGQSTNHITYSQDFSDSSYTKNNATITSGFLSPDGNNNATKVIVSANNGELLFSAGSGNSNTKAVSVFAKADTTTSKLTIIEQYYVGHKTVFDLNLGVVEFSNAAGSKIEDYGNGWYRCTHIQSYTSGQNNSTFAFRSATTDSFYLWGAMLEQSSYPTSYIPTNGEVNGVTRLADVCNNAGSSDLINSEQGTLYAEIAALANDGTTRRLCLSDGTSSQKVLITFSATTNRVQFEVINSTNQFYKEYVSSNLLNFHKVAIKYNQNDFSVYVNGSKIHSTTSGNAPIGLNKLSFDNGIGSQNLLGKVKSVAVFKEALSDTELQKLTTI